MATRQGAKKKAKGRVRDGVLLRVRVVAKLRNAARFPAVLLVAGAGFGKSEALAQHLSSERRRVVVVPFPKGVNTLKSFLSVLALELRDAIPGMASSVNAACVESDQFDNPSLALMIWAR